MIEARRECLRLVSILSPTRHGDEGHGAPQGPPANLTSNLVAVQFRHADVQESHFRLHGGKSGECVLAIVHDRNFMPLHLQKRGKAFRCVPIVIGNEYPASHERRTARMNYFFVPGGG